MTANTYDAIEIYYATPKTAYNGSLGHQDRSVSVPPQFKDWAMIGTHAEKENSSVVDFRVRKPIEVCGILSGSACYIFDPGELQFILDGTVIGEGQHAWSTTDRHVLLPGRHKLEIRLNPAILLKNKLKRRFPNRLTDLTDRSGKYGDCVWAFREFEGIAATTENTVFLTAAAYEDVDLSMQSFLLSAKQHGVPITPYDTGRQWISYYEHKIHGFLRELYAAKLTGKKYAFSLDSRDIVFIHPVEILLGKFSALYSGKIIVASDVHGVTHPFFRIWLLPELQKRMESPHVEINTGVIAGEIDKLIEVYESIEERRSEYLNDRPYNEIVARLFKDEKSRQRNTTQFTIDNDDQALHIITALTNPEWYEVDGRKILSAFIRDYRMTPSCLDDPRDIDSVCTASIVHGSVLANTRSWKGWTEAQCWSLDSNKRKTLPVKLTSLEVNISYVCNLKCEYCTHLGRYMKGRVPLEYLIEWFAAWKDRVYPNELRILGGEPLLHPQHDEVLLEARKAWPYSKITVITNGTIEPGDMEKWIKLLLENDIHVRISRHFKTPVFDKLFNSMRGRLMEAGVPVEVVLSADPWRKSYQLTRDGRPVPYSSDARTAWLRCSSKNQCTTLLDGKLYKCPQIACFGHAYRNGYIGDEWKFVDTYQPLDPTVSRARLVHFLAEEESTYCRMCPATVEIASPLEKLNPDKDDAVSLPAIEEYKKTPTVYSPNRAEGRRYFSLLMSGEMEEI